MAFDGQHFITRESIKRLFAKEKVLESFFHQIVISSEAKCKSTFYDVTQFFSRNKIEVNFVAKYHKHPKFVLQI